MDELLELDGVVLHDYLTSLMAWVADHVGDVRRVLDLGAGTGNGTVALAQRFGAASVVAVDMSDTRLARIRTKAADLGLASRVRTVEADVAAEWPTLEPVDLVWAANCVHEFPDPDRVLKDVYATLRPGGVLAVSEWTRCPASCPGTPNRGGTRRWARRSARTGRHG